MSHVKMLPFLWPPATVVWSDETAIEVMGPDSTAAAVSHDLIARFRELTLPLVPGPMIILRFWL